MTQLETRYPCPVCLGAKLQKTAIDEAPQLVIDHCPRCGGVWFDYGEVQQLRRCAPKVLWEIVAPHTEAHRMQCPDCHTYLGRDDVVCTNCRRLNVLTCPKCAQEMHVAFHEGIRLDACMSCKGVWFDRHELEHIWRIKLEAALQHRSRLQAAGENAVAAPIVLLDALTWDPWLAFYGIEAASHIGGAAVNVLGAAPEVLSGAGEVVTEAASSVFEAIVEFISGLFG
ncbi:MAG TPA: zf-TFIIB domain-containing protein [Longimicrobiales bacterium]